MPTHARAPSVHGARLFCMLTHAAAQAKLVEAAPPSQRYLDLIVSGAAAIGLDKTYLAWLRGHEVLSNHVPTELNYRTRHRTNHRTSLAVASRSVQCQCHTHA